MWPEVAWVLLGLLLLVVVPVGTLYARRRWLTSHVSSFDCALQLFSREPGVGWSLGVARYRGEHLEWFRAFSLSFRPRVTLTRGCTRYVGRREPTRAETMFLYDDTSVFTVHNTRTGADYNLGVSEGTGMALISWLEAAPPGTYRSSGDAVEQ